MSTGQTALQFNSKALLPYGMMRDDFFGYLKDRIDEAEAVLAWPTTTPSNTPGAAFGVPVAMAWTGTGMAFTAAWQATTGKGSRVVDDPPFAPGYAFEDAGGVTYYVAAGGSLIPSNVLTNPRTGGAEYVQWTEVFGDSDNPNNVADLGGALKIIVDSVTEAGVSNAGRRCYVYLNQNAVVGSGHLPATDDPLLIVEDLIVQWDGANNFIQSSYIGQTTPSLNAADYTVVLQGPMIKRNTVYTPSTTGVFYVGTILGGAHTFDGTGQNVLVQGGLAALWNILRIGTNGDLKVEVKSHVLDANEPQVSVWDTVSGSRPWYVDEVGDHYFGDGLAPVSSILNFVESTGDPVSMYQALGDLWLAWGAGSVADRTVQILNQNPGFVAHLNLEGDFTLRQLITANVFGPLQFDDGNLFGPLDLSGSGFDSDHLKPWRQNILGAINEQTDKDAAWRNAGLLSDPNVAVGVGPYDVTWNSFDFHAQGRVVEDPGGGLTVPGAGSWWLYGDPTTGTIFLTAVQATAFAAGVCPISLIQADGVGVTNIIPVGMRHMPAPEVEGVVTVGSGSNAGAMFPTVYAALEWLRGMRAAVGGNRVNEDILIVDTCYETLPISFVTADAGLVIRQGRQNQGSGIWWNFDGPVFTWNTGGGGIENIKIEGVNFQVASGVNSGTLIPFLVAGGNSANRITIRDCKMYLAGGGVNPTGFFYAPTAECSDLLIEDNLILTEVTDYFVYQAGPSDGQVIRNNVCSRNQPAFTGPAAAGIYVNGGSSKIEFNRLSFFEVNGIRVGNAAEAVVQGNEVYNLASHNIAPNHRGIYLAGSYHAKCCDNLIQATDADVIGIHDDEGAEIIANSVLLNSGGANPTKGIYANAGGAERRSTILSNYVTNFAGVGGYGIRVDQGTRPDVSHNTLYTPALGVAGIELNSAGIVDGVVVADNNVEVQSAPGIWQIGGGTLDDALIHDNKVQSDSQGLAFTSIDHCEINGNRVRGDGVNTTDGIIVLAGDNSQINGNNLRSLIAAGINVGTFLNSTITDNVIDNPGNDGIILGAGSDWVGMNGNVFVNLGGANSINTGALANPNNCVLTGNVRMLAAAVFAGGETLAGNN